MMKRRKMIALVIVVLDILYGLRFISSLYAQETSQPPPLPTQGSYVVNTAVTVPDDIIISLPSSPIELEQIDTDEKNILGTLLNEKKYIEYTEEMEKLLRHYSSSPEVVVFINSTLGNLWDGLSMQANKDGMKAQEVESAQKALSYFQKVLPTATGSRGQFRSYLALTYQGMANAYETLGNKEAALGVYIVIAENYVDVGTGKLKYRLGVLALDKMVALSDQVPSDTRKIRDILEKYANADKDTHSDLGFTASKGLALMEAKKANYDKAQEILDVLKDKYTGRMIAGRTADSQIEFAEGWIKIQKDPHKE
jgi:tetratricopeptide (TPR) repeat protein